jgi:heat-inducible transcriptional repressor
MFLDERKFMILRAIIDDYIMTAVPVGSRTISRKAGVGFSPATIRNEMSDLEELGYLAQPHTSAGRIPSTKAYRLYVDHLLKEGMVNRDEVRRMSGYLNIRCGQVGDVIRSAAQALSDMTNYTALISAPQLESLRIRRVQFVPLSEHNALMIVVTNAFVIKDLVIRLPDGVDDETLSGLSRMLTRELQDLCISQVRARFEELSRHLTENRKLLAEVLDVLENQLAERESRQMVVGGSSNLLNYPEYADVRKARDFLSVLESRERLFPLLRHAGGMEFSIRIGPENDLPELSDCSVITAVYRVGDHSTGTMGVIGPTRMQYGKVLSALSYMGRAITDILSDE